MTNESQDHPAAVLLHVAISMIMSSSGLRRIHSRGRYLMLEQLERQILAGAKLAEWRPNLSFRIRCLTGMTDCKLVADKQREGVDHEQVT